MNTELKKLIEIAIDYDQCLIEKAEDFNLEYNYAIDIEDNSVWYATREERDSDFNKAISLYKSSKKKK